MDLKEYSKNGSARYVGGGGLIALLCAVALQAGITQYVASAFGYHAHLGRPMVGNIYQPWEWFIWQASFYDSAPHVFVRAYAAFYIGMAVIAGGYTLAIAFGARRSRKHFGLHGDSHWATREEIEQSGLLAPPGKPNAGLYCGGWKAPDGTIHYLRHNGPEHMALFAPPRSGKGLSVVVPNLLSIPNSVVVHDQKRELWNLTAGFRAKELGHTVIRFDPSSIADSAAFNPCEEVRVGTPFEVGDAQNIATILVDPDGKGLTDHWAKTSHAFLVGLLLHEGHRALREDRFVTLPIILGAMSDPARPITELYKEMLENKWGPGGTTHLTIAQAGREMLDRPDDERGSVLSSALSYLSLYRDPIVAANVSRSDFKITDLMNSDRPVDLYLCVGAENKDRMRPLMRLIVNQIVRVLMRPEIKFVNGRQVSPHKHRLDLLLDEVIALGKLDVLQESLAYIPGYDIRATLVIQDREQLLDTYGVHTTIPGMCHITVAFAPTEVSTAEWLSKRTGTTTVVEDDLSTSGRRTSILLGNVTHNYRSVGRPLLTPEQVMRLPAAKKDGADKVVEPGELLVFAAGHAPIKGMQTPFFMDKEFQRRAAIPPPQMSGVTVRRVQKPSSGSAQRFTHILNKGNGVAVDGATGEVLGVPAP